jgi:ribose transport system substrate-binding protein
VAVVLSACGTSASPSPAASSGGQPTAGTSAAAPSAAGSTAASTAPSTAGGVASLPKVPGATTRCSEASQDLSKTSLGPNGEASTSATDIPDLTPDQVQQIKDKHFKWAYLPSGASTWFSAVEAGAKDMATQLGFTLSATADSNFDPAKQASDVETAMATHPDAILTLPVDPTSAAQAFKPAVDAGTKLVFNDNGINGYTAGKDYVAIVTGNHFGMGEAAAELMSQALGPQGGDIGFIFHDADFYVTNNRDCRFLAVITQKHPEIKVVAEGGMTEEGQTGDIASAMITQHPGIKAIYVTWSAAATSALGALRAANRTDVKVVAHDLDASNDLDMAKAGNLFGVAADKPYLIGQTQVKAAAMSLLGMQVPGFITVPVVTETKATIVQAWKDSLNQAPPAQILKQLGQ